MTTYYIDNYPFNIEGAQKLLMLWSPDIEWDYENNGYPTGEEELFNWTSEFKPVEYEEGQLETLHVWMKFKVGEKGNWSTPMRINYPTVVEGAKGERGVVGETGNRGLQGLRGSNIEIQYADEFYNIVSYSSSYIVFVRTRIQGGNWSTWIRFKGIDGIGIGGIGLPTGGTDTQVLSIFGSTPVWVNEDDIYNDTDAVNAMGVLGDSNTLNHNRYLDSEAIGAMGVLGDSNPLHHDRYTDAEAIAAVTGGGGLSAVLPITYVGGVIGHDNNNGYRHVPIGGTDGDTLTTNGFGTYSWIRHILQSSLDDTAGSGDTDKVYSADKIVSLLTAIGTYGIKYSWADSIERAAQTGMSEGDLGIQQDTREVYRYDGAAWQFFFDLDGIHDHDSRYYTETELNTSGAGGQVHWDNITNVPVTVGLWQTVGTTLMPTDSNITGLKIDKESNTDSSIEVYNEIELAPAFASFYAKAFHSDIRIACFSDLYSGLFGGNSALIGDCTTSLYLHNSRSGGKVSISLGDIATPTVVGFFDSNGLNLGHVNNTTVEVDSSGYLIGVVKNTGYNLNLGTGAGTVSEGDHIHNGLLYKGLLNNTHDLDVIDYYGLYDIQGAATPAGLPANFPNNTIIGFTNSTSYGFWLKCIDMPGNNNKYQEIGGMNGSICYRTRGLFSWNSWQRFEATDSEMLSSTINNKQVTPKSLKAHEGWITPTLNAHWTHGSPSLQYRKLTNGNLQLRGVVHCDDGIYMNIFTLSSSYIPYLNTKVTIPKAVLYSLVSNSVAVIDLNWNNAGGVKVNCVIGGYIGVDGSYSFNHTISLD